MKTIIVDNEFLKEQMDDTAFVGELTDLMRAWSIISQNGVCENTLSDRIFSSLYIEIAETVLDWFATRYFYDANMEDAVNKDRVKCAIDCKFRRENILEYGRDEKIREGREMKPNPSIPRIPRKMLIDFKRDPNAPDVKAIEPPNGETISPCPFCGSDAKLVLALKEVVPFYVKCASVYCGARGPSTDDRHSAIATWNSRYLAPLDFSQLQSDLAADFKKKHSNPKWEAMQKQLTKDGVINAALIMRVFMFYSRVTKGVKPNITAEAVYWFAAANAKIFAKFPSYLALKGTNKTVPVCVFTAAFCIAKADRSLVDDMASWLQIIRSGKDNEHSPLLRLRNIIKNLTMKSDCLFWMSMKAFDCVLHGDHFGQNTILDHERRRLAKVYKLHYS